MFKNICNFSYITTIEENCDEGTRLKFEGGLDKVEDLDKVRPSSESEPSWLSMTFHLFTCGANLFNLEQTWPGLSWAANKMSTNFC